MSTDTPVEVPLVERLRRIPKAHKVSIAFQFADNGTATGHSIIPVGYLMHTAADELARLREELATRERLYKEQWQRAEQAEARALAAEKDAGNFEAVAYLHEASGVVFTTLYSAVPGTNFIILYRKNDGTFYRHPEGIFLDAAIAGAKHD